MRILKILLIIAVLSLIAITGCKKQVAADNKITAGFVYIGYIGDAGWTYTHDMGRKAMETLPFVNKSTYIENVPEGPEAVKSITKLAEEGHKIIFATSFGHMDAMAEVAAKYPDTIFMHCSGDMLADNMGNYFGHIEEARYLTGIVAGKMTKSNIIGYVAAYPITEVIRGINAFTLGVQSVNPDAQVRVLWTSTWYDPSLEKSVAESLMDSGADILTMHQDTPAIIQAAKAQGKLAIGYHSDMSKYAPETFLTAAVWNWETYYKHVATAVKDGTWTATSDMWGMKEGMVALTPFGPKVPEDVKDIVAQKQSDIVNGKLFPFQGPVFDQTGTVRIKEGVVATIEEELQMDYFVKGVVGTIK